MNSRSTADAAPRSGALLLNLGTPNSASVRDVRRYLREFLSDPRVIDISPVARWLLLHLVILPSRPRRSARAYAKIWTPEGSPLLVHSLALRAAVADALDSPEASWEVELAMRYGKPSIGAALERLRRAQLSRLVVLPLFPQFSEAATGSALAKVHDEIERIGLDLPVSVIPAFYDQPGFVESFAEVTRQDLAGFDADFLLFSYHGLPERQVRATDASAAHCLATNDCCAAIGAINRNCYRAQCYATTRALAAELDLKPDGFSTSFQSRLGRTPWIQPFTDHTLVELAARGARRLGVICPAFTADCLETLEEIGIRAAEQWRKLGGSELRLVGSLNAQPYWARAVAQWLEA